MFQVWKTTLFANLVCILSPLFFTGVTAYGVEDSKLQCYNCTWTRESIKHSHEQMSEPPADLICTDSICELENGSCVKDVTEKDGIVISVHRYCAISNEESGCYTQDEYETTVRKACVCSNWHLCNSALNLSSLGWGILFSLSLVCIWNY